MSAREMSALPAAGPLAGLGRKLKVGRPNMLDAAVTEEKEDDRAEAHAGLEILELRVQGTLAEETVRPIVEKALRKWMRRRVLPGVTGAFLLSLEVRSNGSVVRAWVPETGALSEETVKKLCRSAGKLRFPGSEGTSYIHVRVRCG